MSTLSNPDFRAQSLPELLSHSGRIALFLDFDGVLADIAPTPDSIEVSPQILSRLQTLQSALEGAIAVVSGRELDALDRYLAPVSLAMAGDHGNARRAADGEVLTLNEHAEVAAAGLHSHVQQRFGDDPRIVIERKPSAVAVHYRLAPEREEECITAVAAAIDTKPELSLIRGKMVVEARAAGATKGAAVRGFMSGLPFEGRTPLFIGDDLTDEDGFVAVQDFGGAGIKVGDGDTAAHYRIDGTGAVGALLDAVIEHQRSFN